MNVAIYSRKSKFTGKGDSIENQIGLCKEYVKCHFKADNILIYEDEGYSGGNVDRPQFKKLIADSKNKKIDVLVCYRLDRISRNIADFSALIDDLNRLNISFVSIKEQFDTSTPMGRAMMFIASVFAQLERETIAERIRDNMLELAKTGRWLGGIPPTGYKSEVFSKVTVDGKIRKVFKLVPIMEEQEIIKTIFNKYSELKSQTSLETYLMQNNIKTKNGKYFTRFAIRAILENPVYAIADETMFAYFLKNNIDVFAHEKDFDGKSGIMAYNKTQQTKRKTNTKRDISEWIIAVGKHEGIISGKDFCIVQELILQNADKRYRKPRINTALITGLIRCGNCGSLMRPKMHKKGSNKFSYICEMKDKSKGEKCKQKNIVGNELDTLVLEEIEKLLQGESDFKTKLKEMSTNLSEVDSDVTRKLKQLKTAYNKNKNGIDSLIDKLKYVDNDLMYDLADEIKKLKTANENIENEMRGLNQNISGAISEQQTAELLLDIMNNYFDVFNTLDIIKKRHLLKFLIENIEANGDDITLNFFGNGNTIPFPLCDHFK